MGTLNDYLTLSLDKSSHALIIVDKHFYLIFLKSFLTIYFYKKCCNSFCTSKFFSIILYKWNEFIIIFSDEVFLPSKPLESPIVDYMKVLFPNWKNDVKKYTEVRGTPLILFICPAATRATQLNRLVLKIYCQVNLLSTL